MHFSGSVPKGEQGKLSAPGSVPLSSISGKGFEKDSWAKERTGATRSALEWRQGSAGAPRQRGSQAA